MTVYTVLIDNDTAFGPGETAATGLYARVYGVFDNEQAAREHALEASLDYDFVSVQRAKLGSLEPLWPGEVVVEYEFEAEV